MSGGGESPAVSPNLITAQAWWGDLSDVARLGLLADAQVDGFGLNDTPTDIAPRTLLVLYRRSLDQRTGSGMVAVQEAADAAIWGASARAARLGAEAEALDGTGEADAYTVKGGLAARMSTPEERAKAAWPTVEQQTKCWPPKPKDEEARAVMLDAMATIALKVPAEEIDWSPLAYRLARIPKAREAIFAAMDVEGRPWRWADTVVIVLVALCFMAAGAALLAVAAKVAS